MAKGQASNLLQVLKRPVVTEKSQLLREQNKYVFEVAKEANKLQIKEAVEKAFQVRVIAVNTANVRGKRKRRGLRWYRTPSWKKAIVTLQAGDKIELFEGT